MKREIRVFLLLLITTMILYFPTRNSGFTMDFVSWQRHFVNDPPADVLTSFGYHAQQQISLLLFYVMFHLFHHNGIGWYLVFTLLHAINAWLLFLVFRKLLIRFDIPHEFYSALTAAAFFILSPYQAEVVAWKVCVQYLLTGCMTLLVLLYAFRYFEDNKPGYLIYILVFFLIALFSFEWSVIIPFITLVVCLVWNIPRASAGWKRKTMLLVVIQLIWIPLWLFLNKQMFGYWVGHYGQGVHLHFDLRQVAASVMKYAVKYLFFLRDFDFRIKDPVFRFFEQPIAGSVMIAAFITAALVLTFLFRRIPRKWQLFFFCMVLFAVAILPISNLWMITDLLTSNDRYGYFASMFFFMAITLFFFSFKGWLRNLLIIGWLSISLVLLVRMNLVWMHSGKIFMSLINDFRWYDKKEVFILNIPDNYHGVWMFKIINEPTGFAECLEVIREKPYPGKMVDVAQFNMMHPDDSMRIEIISATDLKAGFASERNKWWHYGGYAWDYGTEDFWVDFENNHYRLMMKNAHPERVYIYHSGGKWKELLWQETGLENEE